VRLVAGTVTVKDLSGDLTIATTAGAIDASGLRGQRVEARTEAGAVTLKHLTPPLQATARTEAGTVTVHVPGSAAYAVDASSTAGESAVRVPTDPASAHRITALSEAGDVTVATP
jgi:DUF4097 and DUF4098 domain-containing protein YvlB